MSDTPLDGPDIDGPAAPPRVNGELVFTAPWQSRLFATTMRLCEQGRFQWDTFRQGLIAQIAHHEAELGLTGRLEAAPAQADPRYDYWGCWQRALEALLADLALVSSDELNERGNSVANRPPDH
jgi:nitrile hydratase accessory protein